MNIVISSLEKAPHCFFPQKYAKDIIEKSYFASYIESTFSTIIHVG